VDRVVGRLLRRAPTAGCPEGGRVEG
jgi:hypothetical protein